jgi:fluoride exporter
MNWLLVACGGAIGASLRYGMTLSLSQTSSLFPWATWWINLLGCFCAGIFFAISQKYAVLQQETRLFLMVGILGGFTTFSSFGLETFQLLRQNEIAMGLAYSLSSLIMGVLLLTAGFYLFQFLLGNR